MATPLLDLKNLTVQLSDKIILKGVDLCINAGEVHAIMGPNGAGKSTLGYALAGREGYTVTQGQMHFKGDELLSLTPEERVAKGLFLSMQYPVEIPGVSTLLFLRTALNSVRKARGLEELDAPAGLKLIREKAKILNIDDAYLKRPINVGFSGGEKKRLEALQMILLEPSLAILDETDSGLDIDALKLVASTINGLRNQERGLLVITHYQRLLDYITPDHIHILSEGKIVRSGSADLAHQLEAHGYNAVASESAS